MSKVETNANRSKRRFRKTKEFRRKLANTFGDGNSTSACIIENDIFASGFSNFKGKKVLF